MAHSYWLIFAIFAILIYGCTNNIAVDSCQEKANSLIPLILPLYWDIHTQNQWQLIPFKWSDSSEVIVDLPEAQERKCRSCIDEVSNNAFFYKGIEVSQKVNYYYSDSTFSYSSGSNKFTVQLVLEQLPGTESVYEVNESERYKSQKFKVKEVVFKECLIG